MDGESLSDAEPGVCLASLPHSALMRVVHCVWSDAAVGLRGVAVLSLVCRALRDAADAMLCTLEELPAGKTWVLRHKAASRAGPPGRSAANAVMGRILRSLRSARVIDLEGMHAWLYDESLELIGEYCTQLEVLRLDHCNKITGSGLAAMVSAGRLMRLRELSLVFCGEVGPGDFLAKLPALRRLNASYCNSLECSQILAHVAPRLETLSLAGLDKNGDALCAALPRLERADFSFLDIGDEGLEALARGCLRLKQLLLARRSNNLWGTGRWSDDGMARLCARLPKLSVRFVM